MAINKNNKVNTILSSIGRPSRQDRKYKVTLGLLDGLEYLEDLDYLEDEIGRLSYSTEEWYEENFEKWLDARNNLRSVYRDNSEAFITVDDLENDIAILEEVKSKMDELGLDYSDLPIDIERAEDAIENLKYFEQRFIEQDVELRSFGLY